MILTRWLRPWRANLDDETGNDEPIATLLAPRAIPTAETTADDESAEATSPELEMPSIELALEAPKPLPEVVAENPPPAIDASLVFAPKQDDLSNEEQQLIASILEETNKSLTGDLTDAHLQRAAMKKIRAADQLAERGATFLAHQRLVEVLRMVSQAKDELSGKKIYSEALARGLRALREAEDFAPEGANLEAELDLSLLAAAHQTPLAQQIDLQEALPGQVRDRYLRYAQLKLAMSVAGDPAGSMALYAMGKVTARTSKND